MKKIFTFIIAAILMFNLATIFESPKTTNNNVIVQGTIYELDDEDHGGLRG
ncbi:hypothetical protein [Caldisalinibacter kiritimatiensis]|uniref:Uncharacterized protein n=1 Tax=Caldisalinibacter kiritimatiensis TaxID=1304284 RepID=R1ASZ0_9FIRM|nr:hypothetical protein [Caldisalinibacter kiritimatiensis]EOD00263.1 hypothetical protein L21TH_1690 [Caldisalinibacter kiritimatiensis]